MEVTWGVVQSVSPVEVRFAGDTTDTAVGLQADGLSLTTSDKVMLAKLGSTGGWAIIAVLVAT